jgi:hypothetical protein
MPQGEKQKEIIANRLKKLAIEPSQLQVLDDFRRLPPVSKRDPDAVRERLTYYFQACQNFEIFPSIESMALCLGVSRQSLLKWSNDSTSQTGQLIIRAKELVSAALSQGSLSGTIPFVYGIFQQKANFGYSDKTEVQELYTSAENDAAIESKISENNLIWCEEIQDFIIDNGGDE